MSLPGHARRLADLPPFNDVNATPKPDFQLHTNDDYFFLVDSHTLGAHSLGFANILNIIRQSPNALPLVDGIVTVEIAESAQDTDTLLRMLYLATCSVRPLEPNQLIHAIQILHKYHPVHAVIQRVVKRWSLLARADPLRSLAIAYSKSFHHDFIVYPATLCFSRAFAVSLLDPFTTGPAAFLNSEVQLDISHTFFAFKLACKKAVPFLFSHSATGYLGTSSEMDLSWMHPWKLEQYSWCRCECGMRVRVPTAGDTAVMLACWWKAILLEMVTDLRETPAAQMLDMFCMRRLPVVLNTVYTCSCSPASVITTDMIAFCDDVKRQLSVMQAEEYCKVAARKGDVHGEN